jgi:outer membrane protein
MKYARRLAAAACAMVLAGCRSVTTPSDSNTPWTPPESTQKPDPVWQEIRTNAIDVSKPLALADLADLALQNNPASRKAWNDARAAAAQVNQARGYFMPTLTAVASGERQRITASSSDFDLDYRKYGPGLELDYLVFNFGGGRKAAVDAALQTVYAADFTFNSIIQQTLLAVETAYYGLISAKAGLDAAETNLKDTKTVLDAAKERKAAGSGTALEVLQAQAAYDQSLYSLAGAKGLIAIARGRLAEAVGTPADTTFDVVDPTHRVPESIAEADMTRLIDDAMQRRPDIAALRANVAAKTALVRVQGASLWPSLYLNGNVNRDYYDTYGGKDFQAEDWAYGGGVSLRWTFFDGFQTANAKRAAREQAAAAGAQLRQAELAASADVWTRYHSYRTAMEKFTASEAYLNSATASHELALDSYKAGLKSILDLLNAEDELATARRQSIVSRLEVFTALANLAYSTGMLERGGMDQHQDILATPKEKDEQP